MRIASFFTFALLTVACSSSSSGGSSATVPCNQDPFECPSDQTCWPTSATALACLNAGASKQGESCTDTLGAATCGAGLFCLQSVSGAAGTCLPYCSTTDPSHGCSSDANCSNVVLGTTGGPEVSICVPVNEPGADAGTDAATTHPDASSDAAADAVANHD